MSLPSNDKSGAASAAAPAYARGVPALPASHSVPSPASSVKPADGKLLVQQARTAINARQFEAAVQHFRAAKTVAHTDPNLAADVAKLRVDLQVAGIDAELLNSPVTAPRPLADGINASPLAGMLDVADSQDPQTLKREALRLLAIGRATLDRGDTAGALQIARQAQALGVPESAFAPGEPRVWNFVLDVESAAKRAGTMDSQIALAGGQQEIGGDEAGFIKQMLFDADADSAPGNAGAVQQVQALGAPVSSDADPNQLYQSGLKALQAGDNELARERFVEAWKYESQLDLATRRQLKDKLTLMQPARRLPSPSDAGEMNAIDQVDAETKEKTRRLYREITTELAKAAEMKEAKPLDSLDSLNRLRRRVDGSTVDETSKRTLARMVDKELEKQKQYVEANRAEIELELQNDAVRTDLATDAAREARIDQEISSLVDTFNDLILERRFAEAEVVAKQVMELKPGSTIATNMFHKSRFGTRDQMLRDIQAGKEEVFAEGLMDVEASASSTAGMDMNQPMAFGHDPQSWHELTLRRSQDTASLFGSVQEQKLKHQLSTPVNVQYKNRPLGEVIADLAKVTGLPIVMNQRAMEAVRVLPDTPVTLDLQTEIELRSALNLILEPLDLSYEIKNEVLQITSAEAKRANVVTRVYKVADLVTPIPNFTSSYDDGLAGALRNAYQMTNPRMDVQMMPVSMTDIATRQANALQPSKMSSNMLGQYAPMGGQGGFGPQGQAGGMGGGGSSFADFDSLMNLIETTVVPDTWEALGGNSTMAPYPQNLSLIISTTSDVHDQIVDLIESLRSLQNLQITIEVRFITLSDSFFEQIGVDFSAQFDDNVTTLPDDDSGPSVSIGWNGSAPTADLDIQLGNVNTVTPAFGGAAAGTGASLGFAILSDIEAFFFLQAAQGDDRTNVMQAPKVTLFDGQIATISDQSQRPFVTSITPVVGDFAVAQQPVIVVLNEGTQLNVQGIVSNDKRFVRLTLVPFFSQIGDVDTFTFEGSRTSRKRSENQEDTNGDGVVNDDDAVDTDEEEEIISGSTVQLPTFAFTQVSTTVSVPDGGTILLGGIKRLSESRAERGVPMLSKIPYVSRLFRNVAIGRDASSLMLMVTPRIIIQEEEEFAQTGFQADR
ncbi:general secretion pathway protein GspD [Stieleria sp. TO1_6]|uniref:type II secretion system protein GspD n=1 Tax=Stieleria tagensis TaxID=2956795 RepID=UPI00209AC2EE|nr:general secretion pathway protein GspD [Stieleria tagensis]MCO8120836.1 general secretion pathway protein GspD [Stieleria tagensis]